MKILFYLLLFALLLDISMSFIFCPTVNFSYIGWGLLYAFIIQILTIFTKLIAGYNDEYYK